MAACATFAVVICWLPSQSYSLAAQLDHAPTETTFHQVLNLLAFFNSCLNPILYGFTNSLFRKKFLEIFTRFGCHCSATENDMHSALVWISYEFAKLWNELTHLKYQWTLVDHTWINIACTMSVWKRRTSRDVVLFYKGGGGVSSLDAFKSIFESELFMPYLANFVLFLILSSSIVWASSFLNLVND